MESTQKRTIIQRHRIGMSSGTQMLCELADVVRQNLRIEFEFLRAVMTRSSPRSAQGVERLRGRLATTFVIVVIGPEQREQAGARNAALPRGQERPTGRDDAAASPHHTLHRKSKRPRSHRR